MEVMRRGLATWIGGLLLAAGALATVAGAAEAWVAVTRETHPGLPGNEIQFLSPARDGGVWVGTLSGLGRLTGNECSTVVEKIEAWCVLEAGDGGLWVGHHNGVLRRTAEGKTTAALAGHTVSPIVEIRPGVLWALAKERATETNRLMAWAGKEWTPVPGSEKLRAVDLFQSRKGQLWVSVDGNGVLEVGADGDLAQARHHHRGLNVSTVAEDGHGRIWCGFWSRGAAVWDGAT